MNVIEVEGLTKQFGQFTAVGGISFQIKKGEIFGLLGPNGAGKTTTIRCLLTLSRPTSGTALVCGYDVQRQPARVRELCGYVPQGVSVDGDLTAYENLLFYAKLFCIPGAVRKRRISEILDFMQLDDPQPRHPGVRDAGEIFVNLATDSRPGSHSSGRPSQVGVPDRRRRR